MPKRKKLEVTAAELQTAEQGNEVTNGLTARAGQPAQAPQPDTSQQQQLQNLLTNAFQQFNDRLTRIEQVQTTLMHKEQEEKEAPPPQNMMESIGKMAESPLGKFLLNLGEKVVDMITAPPPAEPAPTLGPQITAADQAKYAELERYKDERMKRMDAMQEEFVAETVKSLKLANMFKEKEGAAEW